MENYNISKYLNIKFQSWNYDLNYNTLTLNSEYNTKVCEQLDFGSDHQSIDLYNKMKNKVFLIHCPDIK